MTGYRSSAEAEFPFRVRADPPSSLRLVLRDPGAVTARRRRHGGNQPGFRYGGLQSDFLRCGLLGAPAGRRRGRYGLQRGGFEGAAGRAMHARGASDTRRHLVSHQRRMRAGRGSRRSEDRVAHGRCPPLVISSWPAVQHPSWC